MTPQLEDLFAFLRFPSISTDSTHSGDVQACADWLIQKLNRKFRRKPRQRGICGTPLLAAAREAERQPAEPQSTVPYICVTMLLRMNAEKREQEIAARKDEKAENKDSQRDTE